MKNILLLSIVFATGCVSRISIEDGVNKPPVIEEQTAEESGVIPETIKELTPREKI